MAERIILDPSEVAQSGRTAFELTPWIGQEGLDWGDSAIAAFVSEGKIGEQPVDFRIPNRQVSGPLVLVDRGGTTAEQARALIQAKLGLFQREGGTLKRVTNAGGTVYADVVDATAHLTSISGIESVHGQDIDASLSMSLIPDFYGNEVVTADASTTTAAELIWTLTDIEGDYPAGNRMRMVVDNDQASDQMSLIYGFRARNYDSTSTAALAWEAESMTPQNTASKAALSGASGGTVVAGTATATSWDVVGNTTFTHQGHYRVLARTYSSSSAASNIWVRWAYTVDNGVNYTFNNEVGVTAGSVFTINDLGEVDVRKPSVGTSTWAGYLMARGSAGTENIRFDKVWFVPADEYSGVIKDESMAASTTGHELRSEGYFAKVSSNHYERPIFGDLPRLPIPVNGTSGTVQCFVKASRGVIGDTEVNGTSDSIDDISARIYYRPCWLFAP